jgi:transposase
MEQLDYNLLYRWFVGLSPDDPVWDATTFTKNVLYDTQPYALAIKGIIHATVGIGDS